MTPNIIQWATRHHVSLVALQELREIFGMEGGHSMPETVEGVTESAVQSVVRLEAARKGVRLFRNNVGVLQDANGRPVRYGLANDSAQLNKVLKSSDLVGWRPVLITPQHVGQLIAQTVLRECKHAGWSYKGDDREAAQLAWLRLGAADGCDASFCTGEGTI